MKKLIIIGGGFAGAKIAKALEKRFDVILIDSKDYFEFTPSVLRTIVEPEHIKKIQVLHSHYLKKTKIINACVTELKNSYVKTDKNKKYYFDYLVIASGSRYQFPFKEQNIVLASRASHLRNCYEKLCLAKNIVLVGGGIVGVELTAEIANAYSDKNITLIEAGKGLMSRNHNKSAEYVKKYLEKNKVNLIFNEKVKEAKNKKITTNKGRKIKADMIFLCTGITPNSEFIDKKYLNKRKQTLVNDFLQVDNLKNVFAVGDVNNVEEEKTAQAAEKQAQLVIENIRKIDDNKKLKKYYPKKRIMIISLGKYNGIVEYKKFVITGLIPAIAKKFVEFKTMMKYKSIFS